MYVKGTPTSIIYAQEPDINQLNVLKDCNNVSMGNELIPIITQGDQIILPEVLDNVLQMQQQAIQQPQQTLTGVYTLQEEPELEAEENTQM